MVIGAVVVTAFAVKNCSYESLSIMLSYIITGSLFPAGKKGSESFEMSDGFKIAV